MLNAAHLFHWTVTACQCSYWAHWYVYPILAWVLKFCCSWNQTVDFVAISSSSYVLPAVSRWHDVSYKLALLLSRMCCRLILFLDQCSSCVHPGVVSGSPLKCAAIYEEPFPLYYCGTGDIPSVASLPPISDLLWGVFVQHNSEATHISCQDTCVVAVVWLGTAGPSTVLFELL
jgi:hypothetical protein